MRAVACCVIVTMVSAWGCAADERPSGGTGGNAGFAGAGGAAGGGAGDAATGGSGTGGTSDDAGMTNNRNPVEVAAGGSHTCARVGDGTVRCWGFNFWGQVGAGQFDDEILTPQSVPSYAGAVRLTGVEQLALGRGHTCALVDTGLVQCWGLNTNHQVDSAAGTPGEVSPTVVRGLADVVAIAAGEDQSCAIQVGGTVMCWGAYYNGALAGSMTGSRRPTLVAGLSGVTALAVGGERACAVGADQTVQCWGRDPGGLFGDGVAVDAFTPTAVVGLVNVVELALGERDNCARISDGTVQCWGGEQRPGTPIAGLTDVVEIAVGDAHRCARLEDGTVRCWGANAEGQLGNGTTAPSPTPVDVTGLDDVVEIAVGAKHSCARLANDTIQCWGLGAAGQLGNNSTDPQSTPVAVRW